MAIAFGRPLQQQGFTCNVTSCSDFGNTDNTTKLQLRFHSEPTYVESTSLQSTQELLCKRAAITTRNTTSSLARRFNLKKFSGTSQLSRSQRTASARCLRSYLTMETQCLPAKNHHSFQDERGLASTVKRHVGTAEDTFSGSCPDPNTLDKWLRDAVFEIVRHLQEAPFLHFVLDPRKICQKPERQKISREFINRPDLWTIMRDSMLESSPVGLILVQKLDQQCLTKFCLAEHKELMTQPSSPSNWKQNDEISSTDVWGILVEGRGIVWNACYILKTTRVASSTGICTHFCLTKAKCFGPSLQEQLEKMWLL
ncbi:hypothetical protein O6H91_18G083800 [Diphasiastrum complanatum]|uniref:Uncharacterized protein n=1 Tax=Diphasiastrum complanatum TaxID=34168 RepID=A0ACC2B3D1_DIPCM|nr:hypothetical protein O6H91_18G083800 [Diphasiastrum complanatum]